MPSRHSKAYRGFPSKPATNAMILCATTETGASPPRENAPLLGRLACDDSPVPLSRCCHALLSRPCDAAPSRCRARRCYTCHCPVPLSRCPVVATPAVAPPPKLVRTARHRPLLTRADTKPPSRSAPAKRRSSVSRRAFRMKTSGKREVRKATDSQAARRNEAKATNATKRNRKTGQRRRDKRTGLTSRRRDRKTGRYHVAVTQGRLRP